MGSYQWHRSFIELAKMEDWISLSSGYYNQTCPVLENPASRPVKNRFLNPVESRQHLTPSTSHDRWVQQGVWLGCFDPVTGLATIRDKSGVDTVLFGHCYDSRDAKANTLFTDTVIISRGTWRCFVVVSRLSLTPCTGSMMSLMGWVTMSAGKWWNGFNTEYSVRMEVFFFPTCFRKCLPCFFKQSNAQTCRGLFGDFFLPGVFLRGYLLCLVQSYFAFVCVVKCCALVFIYSNCIFQTLLLCNLFKNVFPPGNWTMDRDWSIGARKWQKKSWKVSLLLQYQVRTIFWHNRRSGAVPHVSNRMKRSNLQKRDKTFSVLGCAGCVEERISLCCRQVTSKVPKTVKNLFSCSFAVEMGHLDMVRWKYDSVCIFSMLRDTLELILWKKADKKCKDQKRSIFFAKGALIRKSIFQTQRINAVHGRCSSSNVLRHIPSNLTRSVRRRIVL